MSIRRFAKIISVVLLIAFTGAAVQAEEPGADAPAPSADFAPVDKVVVRKSKRVMELYRRGKLVRTYKVALGLRPGGHKEQEGDFRTPEGRYTLERRNPNSDYFLSIQISYPNAVDMAHAKKLGVSPGSAIMIHGLPNNPSKSMAYYSRMDWTDGCIAVSNSDMVEIWLMTAPGTPIEILP